MLLQKNLGNKEKIVALLFRAIWNVRYIKAYIYFKVADVDLNILFPHMDGLQAP